MKQNLSFFTMLLISISALGAAPTNNPIAEFYNGDEGYPAWTDQIKWDNVITMTNQGSGAANTADFNAKRDQLYNMGGGVLYYPAGTYVFDVSDAPNSEGLMLKKGVVIRGEKPTSDASAVLPNPDITSMLTTDHGLNNLPTKFKFTTTRLANDTLKGDIAKMWNCIGIKKGTNETGLDQVEKVGISWVEIEYGYIFFGFDATKWASTWATAGYNYLKPIEPWKSTRVPDGTHPMDAFAGNFDWKVSTRCKMGAKRFVFGVHVKHGGVPNYVVSKGMGSAFWVEDGPYHFGAKIAVYGSNLFIANNVVSKPTKCFKMQIMAGVTGAGAIPLDSVVTVPYDFAKGASFDVNKAQIAGFLNNSAVDDPSSQYANNVQVIDNWAYNHSNKGYDLAGGWMVVKNNINRRDRYQNQDVYGLGLTKFYGVFWSGGLIYTENKAADFLARAFTVSSKNAWYHKNQWNNTGTLYDNSAEGILHQDHLNGSECFSAALTYNRGNSYVGVWNSFITGLFLGFNEVTSDIMIAHSTYVADATSVEHRNMDYGTEYFFTATGNTVKDMESFNCSSGGTTPGTPTIQVKDTADYVKITWTNVANEAAYRVEKKKKTSSDWQIIAYRPRQNDVPNSIVSFKGVEPSIYTAEGHGADAWDGKVRDMNPKEWRDYLKSSGEYDYRVVAIGCEDLTSTAVATPITITIPPSGTNASMEDKKPAELVVYPNPSTTSATIQYNVDGVSNINLISLSGNVIKQIATNDKSGVVNFNTSDLPSGVYIIEVISTNSTKRTQLLVQ